VLAKADRDRMGRSVVGLRATVGMTAGGFAPAVWGAASLSPSSLLLGVSGAIARVRLGARLL
jgi:hypothetical protein